MSDTELPSKRICRRQSVHDDTVHDDTPILELPCALTTDAIAPTKEEKENEKEKENENEMNDIPSLAYECEVVGAWYGLNPCPAPTNSADSEDFDSQLTENEDPCAPEPLAPPPPWHADPQILKQIVEHTLPCADEGWFRDDCMERVLGLEFEDAMDLILAHIASHLARFDNMYIGVTSRPYRRWHENVEFVGHKYVYEGLDCLYVHPKSHACHQGSGGAMERKLIAECRARGWPIENKLRSKGGECATGSPSFVYLAWSRS